MTDGGSRTTGSAGGETRPGRGLEPDDTIDAAVAEADGRGVMRTPRRFTTLAGRPHPLGATPDAKGTNFALFTRHATMVELLIFERHDSPKPTKTIRLNPDVNRTFYFWHIYVFGVTPGMGYAYRVDGPKDLHGAGHRFNPNKVLIDPYGTGAEPRRRCGTGSQRAARTTTWSTR
jgi:pullulanase/glycogen debranching enzyme